MVSVDLPWYTCTYEQCILLMKWDIGFYVTSLYTVFLCITKRLQSFSEKEGKERDLMLISINYIGSLPSVVMLKNYQVLFAKNKL